MNVEDISHIITQLERNMERRHVHKDVAILTRLSVEDAICKFHDKLGDDAEIKVRMHGIITPNVVVTAKGEYCNPFEETVSHQMLRFVVAMGHAGLTPSFSRHNGVNTVVYKLPSRKIGDLHRIILAVVLAVIIAFIMRGTMSQTAINSCVTDVLKPLSGTFLGLLSAVVVPLIFFSVVKAVMNAGDGESMSKMGRLLFRNVLGLNCVMLILAVFICMLVFGIVPHANGVVAGAGGHTTMETFFNMFFPDNIVETFAQGKTAQVLFMAIMTGIALLRLKDRGRLVCDFVTQVSELIMIFMSWIAKLLPLFIFDQLLILILSGGISMFTRFSTMIAVYYIQLIILYLLFTLYAAHRLDISWMDYLHRTAKVFFVGMSTMSSIISIPTMIECGEKKLGLNRKFCDVMIPTVVTMTKVLGVCTMSYISLCGVDIYGVSISWQMICMFVFFAFVLSVASPSVPGGVIATLAMLFSVLGLPMEYVGMAAMIIPFLELLTGVQTVCSVTHVLLISKDMDE